MPKNSLDDVVLDPEGVADHEDALSTAVQLQRELGRLGIASDVHDGYGLALLSVWVGLVVWCDGERFWWRTGWDERRRRVVYAWHPVFEATRAARRVAFRYAELRQSHPLSEKITDLVSAAATPREGSL